MLDEFIALYSQNWQHRSHTTPGEQATEILGLGGSPKFRLMISPLASLFSGLVAVGISRGHPGLVVDQYTVLNSRIFCYSDPIAEGNWVGWVGKV